MPICSIRPASELVYNGMYPYTEGFDIIEAPVVAPILLMCNTSKYTFCFIIQF